MHPDMRNISKHMFDIGIGVLSQAQRKLFYSNYMARLEEGVFGVLQAAHACELIIKAAIAEEHPLLIFSSLPKSVASTGKVLGFRELFENGRTIQYADLPEKLWAVKGYNIQDIETYSSFGKLRNCIQHFAMPDTDLSRKGVEFIYKVLDPVLERFWGEYAVDYCDLEEHENEIFDILVNYGIQFRYPEHFKEQAEAAIKSIR